MLIKGQKISLPKLFGVVFVISAVASAVIYAADVTISESITIPLTIGGQTENLTLYGGDLNVLTVESDKLHISTPASKKIRLEGSPALSFGAATDCSTAGKSVIEVPENTSVVITPTRPATTDAEYRNSCSGRSALGGGGGGGGGGGSGSTGGTVAPGYTPPANVPQTGQAGQTADMLADISSLAASSKKEIKSLVDIMLGDKTYVLTSNKNYGPKSVVKGSFAIRILASVSGVCCKAESVYPGFAKIKDSMEKSGLFPVNIKTADKLTRADFYSLLLKSIDAKTVKASAEDLGDVCKDVKKLDKKTAQLFFTAQKYKIASIYAGKKCRLDKTFSRAEAAKWAVRALNAKADIKAKIK